MEHLRAPSLACVLGKINATPICAETVDLRGSRDLIRGGGGGIFTSALK